MNLKAEFKPSELYALERAARSARAREIARLILAGVDALGRLAKRAVSLPHDRKDLSHA